MSAMCANESVLMVGRASGVVHRYSLPHLTSEGQHVLRCRPHMLALNNNLTRMVGTGVWFAEQDSDRRGGQPRAISYRSYYVWVGWVGYGSGVAQMAPRTTSELFLCFVFLSCVQSIIDINGVLSFYDLTAKGGGGVQGEHLTFERKVGGCENMAFILISLLQLPWQGT